MKNFFRKYQTSLILKQASKDSNGFRNCQLGAIWAAKSHFTASNARGLINLPTGAGKTAVMMALAFELSARRVFIITPSMFSREQTANEFRSLRQLSHHIGALKRNLKDGPRVKENETELNNAADWRKLLSFDVVVTTPNAIQSSPPPNLFGADHTANPEFDLVFVDEAHHSAADTWTAFLDQVHAAKVLLFTATPFRRDRKRIRAKPIYVYPISSAIKDGIYRPVELVALETDKINRDAELARACRDRFFQERKKAPEIAMIVKARDINHSEELKTVYSAAGLKNLEVIHSDKSFKDNHEVLEKVKKSELDGFICVDIGSEGIDVPNLRIAVFHDLPQTLPYTIQVIGRVTRMDPEKKGNALLIADRSDAKGAPEIQALYASDEGWMELLPELFEDYLNRGKFLPTPGSTLAGPAALPADDLNPYQTVRVYQQLEPLKRNRKSGSADSVVFSAKFDRTKLRGKDVQLEVFDKSDERVVVITRTWEVPSWTTHRSFETDHFDLHIYCYVKSNGASLSKGYVFEFTTSEKIAGWIRGGFWDTERFCRARYHVIRSGLADAPDAQYLMVGMVKQTGDTATPQYKTLIGEHVQNAVKSSDGRSFSAGHAMIATKGFTRGIATHSSRVWSNARKSLEEFEEWCKTVADALAKEQAIPKLENKLMEPIQIDKYPSKVEIVSIVFDDKLWRAQQVTVIVAGEVIKNPICFFKDWTMNRSDNTIAARLVISDQRNKNVTELPVEHRLIGRGWSVDSDIRVRIQIDRDEQTKRYDDWLERYLQENPPLIVLTSSQTIRDDVLFTPKIQTLRLDIESIDKKDWKDTDITKEADDPGPGFRYNVQKKTEKIIEAEYKPGPKDFLICDDRANEVADYVLIQDDPRKRITFFHCKYKTGTKKDESNESRQAPGLNKKDLTELTEQAVRTGHWIRTPNLIDRLLKRLGGRSGLSRMVHGTLSDLKKFSKSFAPDEWSYAVVLVQPGLSGDQLVKRSTASQAEQLLIVVSDRIVADYSAGFKVWTNNK